MKNKLAIFSVIAVLIGILIMLGVLTIPFGGKTDRTTYIEIEQGESLTRIAANLEKRDLVISKSLFKWASFFLGKRKSIKSGEYEIIGPISTFALIRLLSKGTTILKKITIPEGLRMNEIFELLTKSGLGTHEKYRIFSRQKAFIQSLGLGTQTVSLEGFLFPETYLFSKNTSAQTVIRTMVKAFFDNIPDNYEDLAKSVNLTFYEAVILASIIEKETGASSERKLIASVFHNRLKHNMLLQTDPTVIYGIENFNGNLTRKQLRTGTPYNTYVVNGLPPTPIANPGLASLDAAVHPDDTDFLFFVAKGDGTHKFTSNYKDHEHAVTKYQLKRRRNYKSF
ncbi:MAG: endolytic transglycosylase MltG [SAR324 cluster bacterium]|nr:endolytic transglycosylase MltG [SAR324 cluster bacterium]